MSDSDLSTSSISPSRMRRHKSSKGSPLVAAYNVPLEQQLLLAAGMGDIRSIKEILKMNEKCNSEICEEDRCSHDKGFISVNATDINGDTPLMLAARHGHLAVVKHFLKPNKHPTLHNSVLVNEVNSAGYTAIELAVIYNHLNVAIELKKAGATIRTESVALAIQDYEKFYKKLFQQTAEDISSTLTIAAEALSIHVPPMVAFSPSLSSPLSSPLSSRPKVERVLSDGVRMLDNSQMTPRDNARCRIWG